jgi:hypothetical protein
LFFDSTGKSNDPYTRGIGQPIGSGNDHFDRAWSGSFGQFVTDWKGGGEGTEKYIYHRKRSV